MTLINIKRGLIRLWIVIASTVDVYLLIISWLGFHAGESSPLDSSWVWSSSSSLLA